MLLVASLLLQGILNKHLQHEEGVTLVRFSEINMDMLPWWIWPYPGVKWCYWWVGLIWLTWVTGLCHFLNGFIQSAPPKITLSYCFHPGDSWVIGMKHLQNLWLIAEELSLGFPTSGNRSLYWAQSLCFYMVSVHQEHDLVILLWHNETPCLELYHVE